MREILFRYVRRIYNDWHQCALKPKDAIKMGLHDGRLCDMCDLQAKATVEDMLRELVQ